MMPTLDSKMNFLMAFRVILKVVGHLGIDELNISLDNLKGKAFY
jgi:hypothetical protein